MSTLTAEAELGLPILRPEVLRCDFGVCDDIATHKATWRNDSGDVTEARPLCTKHATGRGFTALWAGATVEQLY
jgi:hypothetical protein